MNQDTVEVLDNTDAVKELDDKAYTLSKFQDFTEEAVFPLTKSSAFTVPVKRFIRRHIKSFVAKEISFNWS